MEKMNNVDVDKMLVAHEKYVTTKILQNTVLVTLAIVAVAAYTSLWWAGIVLKSDFALLISITITVLAIIIFIVIALSGNPTWNTKDILAKDKDCCVKKDGCDCETK